MCLRVVLPSGEMSLCSDKEKKTRGQKRKEMEKYVTELWCDRCKRRFERQESQFGDTLTMTIGWFKLLNGSGSKISSPPSREHSKLDNLDYDLCPDCTKEFEEWWENSPPKQKGETYADAGD